MSALATYMDIYNLPGVVFSANPPNGWYEYPKLSSIAAYCNAEVAWGYTSNQLVQLADISGPRNGLLSADWNGAQGPIDIAYIAIGGAILDQISLESQSAVYIIPSYVFGYNGVELYVGAMNGGVNGITVYDSNGSYAGATMLQYYWNLLNYSGDWGQTSSALVYISA